MHKQVHVFHVTSLSKDAAAASAAAENAAALDQVQGRGPGQGGSGAPERPLVGRDTETTFIMHRAANMIAGRATGGAVVIEGNTGEMRCRPLAAQTSVRARAKRALIALVLPPALARCAGMGKTKLLMEVRRSLERVLAEAAERSPGVPAFHMLFGVADIANKNSKLHPWRRAFQDLFTLDRTK